MKAYVITTGIVFALLALVHVARVVAEGWHVARDPFFTLITAASAGLSLWAFRLAITKRA
jgi:hypothetical protein